MIMKLWDGYEMMLDSKESQAVKKAIFDKKEAVIIRGHMIKTSAISHIIPGGNTEPDRPSAHKQLVEPEPKLGAGYNKFKLARDKLAREKNI